MSKALLIVAAAAFALAACGPDSSKKGPAPAAAPAATPPAATAPAATPSAPEAKKDEKK